MNERDPFGREDSGAPRSTNNQTPDDGPLFTTSNLGRARREGPGLYRKYQTHLDNVGGVTTTGT